MFDIRKMCEESSYKPIFVEIKGQAGDEVAVRQAQDDIKQGMAARGYVSHTYSAISSVHVQYGFIDPMMALKAQEDLERSCRNSLGTHMPDDSGVFEIMSLEQQPDGYKLWLDNGVTILFAYDNFDVYENGSYLRKTLVSHTEGMALYTHQLVRRSKLTDADIESIFKRTGVQVVRHLNLEVKLEE